MFQPLLAAMNLDDWIEVVVVVVVVAGSVIGKIAQSLIQYFNKSNLERSSRPGGQDTMRPRSARSDRPVARPMPNSLERRPSVAPFGDVERRPRTEVFSPPPVAPMPEVLQDALGDVFARLGLPETRQSRSDRPPPAATNRARGIPGDARQRRTIVARTMRAPVVQPIVSKRSARPRGVVPPDHQDAVSASGPAHAEEHLGHLRSGVEAREVAIEQAGDHLEHLKPHIVAQKEMASSRSAINIRALLGLQNRNSIRRAILLSEVLGPPLALRDIG